MQSFIHGIYVTDHGAYARHSSSAGDTAVDQRPEPLGQSVCILEKEHTQTVNQKRQVVGQVVLKPMQKQKTNTV